MQISDKTDLLASSLPYINCNFPRSGPDRIGSGSLGLFTHELKQERIVNRQRLKKTTAAMAIALVVSIGSSFNVAAAADTPAASKPAATESLTEKRKLLEERLQKIEHEAHDVIQGTQNALIALQNKDKPKAMTLLEDVSGKLDILLAKHPSLTLLPAEVSADIYDFEGNSKQVEKLVDEADDLLDDHKVQDARHILAELVSEIRITTTSIPLGTFPVAIKEAVRLVDQGKTDEAADALFDVLNLLVKTTEIIPLPALRAEALLNAASELEHKSDLSKEASRKEILKLTDDAKEKLKLAEILGYGSKEDYRPLYDTIDEIKDVIHSEKSEATWDKVKKSVSAFKNKIIHPKKAD